jgi:hypothetical protein
VNTAIKLVEDDQVRFSAIPKSMIPIIWDEIEPLLELAIEFSSNELDLDILRERLMEERMLLVLVNIGEEIVAAITVEIKDFDTGKRAMFLTTVGGKKMEIWMDEFSDLADELASDKGCEDIYIIGRPGWAKALKKHRFGVCHTVLSRKVRKN